MHAHSSMFMLFFYLDPLQNDSICRGREFKIYDKSVLPGTKKERKEREINNWPLDEIWMRNLCLFCAQTRPNNML